MHAFQDEEIYRNSLLHERQLDYIAAMQQQHSRALLPPALSHGDDQDEEDHHHHATFKSRSIPIHNNKSGMKRTPSEVKLREDQELADYRDYVMFRRIVDRLSKQQEEIKDHRLRMENDMCLAHVIGIRNGSEDGSHSDHHHHDQQQQQNSRYILSNLAQQQQQQQAPSFAAALFPNLQQDEDEIFELEL